MMAAAGSPLGMRGIETMPAPSRPRLLEERVPVRADRPDRAVVALAEVDALVDALVAVDAAVRADTAGAAVAVPDASGDGAVPQTSQ
jgi:hypothetical protein